MYQTSESLSSLSTWLQLTHNWHSLTRLRLRYSGNTVPDSDETVWLSVLHHPGHHTGSHPVIITDFLIFRDTPSQPSEPALYTLYTVYHTTVDCCTPGIKTLYSLYTLLTTIPRHIIIVHPHLFDLALKAVAELSNIDVFNQRQSDAAIAFKSLVSHHHLETSFPVSSQLAG